MIEQDATRERINVLDITVSSEGIDAIKQREGLRLHAYDDGGGTRTIGYGHTGGIRAGEYITEQQAEQLLHVDLIPVETEIKHDVRVPLYQWEFDALASFIYNIGRDGFRRSTVLKRLNEGRYRDAALHMTSWHKINGQISKGLWRRRKAEVLQWAHGEKWI